MLDLGGADAEGERAERAVRGGMAVAADQGGARKGKALLGSDDMDDALCLGGGLYIGNTELRHIGFQRGKLLSAAGIGDRQPRAPGVAPRRRRRIRVEIGRPSRRERGWR